MTTDGWLKISDGRGWRLELQSWEVGSWKSLRTTVFAHPPPIFNGFVGCRLGRALSVSTRTEGTFSARVPSKPLVSTPTCYAETLGDCLRMLSDLQMKGIGALLQPRRGQARANARAVISRCRWFIGDLWLPPCFCIVF